MRTQIIEATSGGNWGKFLVGHFDAEWDRASEVDPSRSVLGLHGWSRDRVMLVLDLATGEGALFNRGGVACADLNQHRVWVCPLFEPFLDWLYAQPLDEPLPGVIQIDDPFEWRGHRRPGPTAG